LIVLMSRFTPRRSEPVVPAAPPAQEAPAPPEQFSRGWRVALIVWALAFGALLLFEFGTFLWSAVKRLF
jgi:hypothetical protein